MAIITWENGSVPEGMEIKQIYGIIFKEDGRIMLRAEQKLDSVKFSLAEGHPEPFDDGIEGACRRELIEEINTTIHQPIYVGYQLIDEEDGTPFYAQVRMAAVIDSIGTIKPDPLTSPDRASELLN